MAVQVKLALGLPTVVIALVLSGCPSSPSISTTVPATPDLAMTASGSTPTPAERPSLPKDASGLGSLRQPAPMRLGAQPASLYEVGAFPLRQTELQPGPDDDRQLVEVYCVGCHSTAYIAMQPPLSRAGWEAEVKKMRGAFGAVIPDPAATRIATYLSSYYGSGK